MATTIRYSDSRPNQTCGTLAEAKRILASECEVIEECGDRWLAWATRADADHQGGDDGSQAVAEIRVNN